MFTFKHLPVRALCEMSDDKELVDPQDVMKEECGNTKHCISFKEELQKCNDRVRSKTKTSETCTQELFDFLHCVDHCVSKKLFKHLK